ncbi:MAG: internalization-related competence protein ComEC/Rec2 protein [Parcubacteria group bacterium GW2011_GWD2_38_11]|nr:MAG: internalization-related competence protein ComEC/Rec2 protein [Parcubacteria group bacterium GW2011_GWD2_38_11]
MSKSRVFLFTLLSFILGVFARSFFELSQNYFFLLTFFSLIVLFIFYKNKFVALASFFVLSFVLGGWITDKEIEKTKNLIYSGKIFQENAIVEKVTPSAFGQNIVAKFSKEKILVLIQSAKYPEYFYGDVLEISCTLKPIENLDASFDYKMYMAKEGVLYQCKGKTQKIAENKGNWIYSKIISARKLFENKINKVIPHPYSALANGLLFGGGSGLSKEIQNDFSRTGMTHIVAVSGYNVTIIAEYLIILGIFLGLWRKQAIWFAIIGIALFVVMVGFPSSAVRAGVMSGILLWAMKNGRLASSENAIIFAGAVMLALNPLLLRWDVGFQLSFLATLGIVASASFWEKSFIKKHKALGISEIILLSLSAQIFVLPIIAYNFNIVSPISLLANIFILPIVPLSMLLVFLVCLFGFIFSPLSLVFSWLAFLLLYYEIKLIHILAQFPGASISVENVSPWYVVLYYIVLCFGVFYTKRMQNLKSKIENEK